MSINREATIRWKGYDPVDLSPGSDKRIWANCDICGYGRWVYMHSYRDLCKSCGTTKYYSDQDNRNAQSNRLIEYYSDPDNRNARAKSLRQYHIDNPEAGEAISARQIQYYIDNPEAGKAVRGGNTLVNHHYIYDHANPEKYTMKVTCSKHIQIHWWMKKAGIKIPHINKDAAEWRYVKC